MGTRRIENFRKRVTNRQSNILPHNLVGNEANLWGALVLGGRPLNSVQRLGALIFGFLPLAAGSMTAWSFIKEPSGFDFKGSSWPIVGIMLGWFTDLTVIVVALALLLFGLRITMNAIRAPRPK